MRGYYSPDGSIRSVAESGLVRTGKWWVNESDNTRCIRWDDKGKDFCHYTERNADGTHSLIHRKKGKVLVEFKDSRPGNQLE